MKYRDNEPKVDVGLAAALKAIREIPPINSELKARFEKCLEAALTVSATVINTAEVIQLDTHRSDPHLVVVGEKRAHVVPVSLIEGVINGTYHPANLDAELIRDILRDWLTQVQADADDGK